MAKLTREQKILIYERRKNGEMISKLEKEFNISNAVINYLIALIDTHGYAILRVDKNRYYSSLLKQEIIEKVLVENQSVRGTAIEYGLASKGMLSNWIKSYKDNNYVIVEKKKGRSSTMINKEKKKKKNEYKGMTSEEKIKFLENQNLYLEAENEYLKKLRAVIQARKNQQQKK